MGKGIKVERSKSFKKGIGGWEVDEADYLSGSIVLQVSLYDLA